MLCLHFSTSSLRLMLELLWAVWGRDHTFLIWYIKSHSTLVCSLSISPTHNLLLPESLSHHSTKIVNCCMCGKTYMIHGSNLQWLFYSDNVLIDQYQSLWTVTKGRYDDVQHGGDKDFWFLTGPLAARLSLATGDSLGLKLCYYTFMCIVLSLPLVSQGDGEI
jgi:hypothetical protein